MSNKYRNNKNVKDNSLKPKQTQYGKNKKILNKLHSSFASYCRNNNVSMVRSLLSDISKDFLTFWSLYDKVFMENCSNRNIDIINYLGCEENQPFFTNLEKTLNLSFRKAIKENHFDTIQSLISLPNVDKSSFFNIAFSENHEETIKYLIFDCNIEKTQQISDYIDSYDNEKVENMFKIRTISQQLTQELNSPKSDTIIKKLKI